MPDIQSQIDSSLNSATASYKFPLTGIKYATYIDIFEYSFRSGEGALGSTGVGDSNTSASIALPLPVQLNEVERVRWDEKAVLPWASMAKAALAGFVGGVGSEAVGQTATRAARIASGGAAILGAGVAAAGPLISGYTGLAPNEFHTMLFDRPEFKTHELSFKLSPRNYAEADQIQQIINQLKKAQKPGLAGGNAFFTYPSIVQCRFQPNEHWLFKFKPCVIRVLAAQYAPEKKAFYAGDENPPESVHMTIQLTEIEFWLKENYA